MVPSCRRRRVVGTGDAGRGARLVARDAGQLFRRVPFCTGISSPFTGDDASGSRCGRLRRGRHERSRPRTLKPQAKGRLSLAANTKTPRPVPGLLHRLPHRAAASALPFPRGLSRSARVFATAVKDRLPMSTFKGVVAGQHFPSLLPPPISQRTSCRVSSDPHRLLSTAAPSQGSVGLLSQPRPFRPSCWPRVLARSICLLLSCNPRGACSPMSISHPLSVQESCASWKR